MAFQNSPFRHNDEYDQEDDRIMDDPDEFPNQDEHHGGDESEDVDTEEASENDLAAPPKENDEPIEIKEQMYQDKLANLNKQLEELRAGTHPEYVRRVKKLEYHYKERLRLNEIYRDYMVECVERDYILEKKAAVKEYDEKKADLRENLLTDFEDKRKMIESERNSMELTGDCMEVKPTVTRKLRRRPNDPLPVVEKRRKPPSGQLVLLLEEKDVENDLKMISRGKAITPIRSCGVPSNGLPSNNIGSPSMANEIQVLETKIEDGKLWYERRWFHRGQPIYVEGKDIPRFAATISAIGSEVIWVKKLNDNGKVRIYTTQLSRGKISIKRRAN